MNAIHTLSKLGLAIGLITGASFANAALIGLTPGEPVMDFGGDGLVTYDETTGVVTISGLPATLSQTMGSPFIFGEIMGATGDDEKLITVSFKVDGSGNFVSGVDGPDLVVKGSVDVDFDGLPDYDGILLEGEVAQFGFQDGGSTDDAFDLRINITGGALNEPATTTTMQSMPALYGNNDLALQVTSEVSAEYPTPFNGSFAAAFTGPAKGNLGSTLPPVNDSCSIEIDATCSVDGGPNMSKCRIKVSKSPKHWEHHWVNYHGHSCRKAKYGMHGQNVPSWANHYPKTDVKFTYVITNTGSTAISNLMVDDSFDTGVTGVPLTLEPGQSVTVMRTEKLNEKMENLVTVMGESGTAQCSDKDSVVIRDKLRDRRHHDDDHFKDKGKRDHH